MKTEEGMPKRVGTLAASEVSGKYNECKYSTSIPLAAVESYAKSFYFSSAANDSLAIIY